jgi:hypothetical protein
MNNKEAENIKNESTDLLFTTIAVVLGMRYLFHTAFFVNV